MGYERVATALISVLLGAGLLPGAAEAQGISLDGSDGSLLELGAGGYDILHNYTAGMFRGEYRFASDLFYLHPLVGAEVTTDGSVYGYAGLALNIYFGSNWVLTPNEAVGLWSRGDGKELGSTVEFRSGAEFDYRFEDTSRIGFSFHHISNAGIGKHNPGEEEALIVYSLALPGLP